MNNISLYIHYPFCNSKCPYCDFNSFANLNIEEDILLRAYLKEINSYHTLLPRRKIQTIFFGGGTPSLMSASFMEALLKEVYKLWSVDKNAEISLEANPSTVEFNKFESFKNAGVNRLSLGIQALNDKDLKFLGRTHNLKDALQAINLAQKLFYDKYSIDLIYARPRQTKKQWEQELRQALQLSPYHLSLYQLTIEKGTPFYVKNVSPAEEALASDLYTLANEITEIAGIPWYEVSNYAKRGYECKHNLNYWRSGEWVGIGAGAHSRIQNHNTRIAIENIKNPTQWVKEVQKKNFGFKEKYDLTEEEFIHEFLLMGLRLRSGVTNKDLQKYLKNKKISDIINLENCGKFQKQNFIELSEKGIKVKESGILFLNKIIEDIVI